MQSLGYRRISKCRLCDGAFFDKIVKVANTPTANQLMDSRESAKSAQRIPLELAMCSKCKHIQLLDIVDANKLFADYIYKSGTSETFIKHFRGLASTISELDLEINYVLEVGSNDGTLLQELGKRGVRSIGIEPSQLLVSECNASGLETYCGFFNDETVARLKSSFGEPSVIVGNNVFAHIDDLNDAFDCVSRNLSDDGFFIFEVADVSQIIKKGYFDSIYHEHMSYHSVISMLPMALKHGFSIFKVERVDTHGGSFRFFLTKLGKHNNPATTDAMVLEEEQLGLDSVAALIAIENQIESIRTSANRELSAVFSDAKNYVIGYGAPAKVVTFLSATGLENISLVSIVDDNQLKQGKFIPGSGFQILSLGEVQAQIENHDQDMRIVCLIFPWNLGQEIKGKLVNWLPRGSQVITFFPEVIKVEL